jgi:hypothetical protein
VGDIPCKIMFWQIMVLVDSEAFIDL